MTLIVNIIGCLLIIFVYWFFFMKKDKETKVDGHTITVVVDGGYNPGKIVTVVGKPLTIVFDRRDSSSCLDEVVLPDFGIRQSLSLNKKTSIEILPNKVGTYDISCGMNMQHAKLVVEEE